MEDCYAWWNWNSWPKLLDPFFFITLILRVWYLLPQLVILVSTMYRQFLYLCACCKSLIACRMSWSAARGRSARLN